MEKIIFFGLVIPIFIFVLYLGGRAIMTGFSAKNSNKSNSEIDTKEETENLPDDSQNLTNELNKQIEILKAENNFQKNVIQQHNLDQEELEFLRLNLIYSSKCQSKKLFSTGFKVGTPEYKECIMRKGKISD